MNRIHADELASEVGMKSIGPASVVDEFGVTAGFALPEAGVLVVLAGGKGERVAELVYERIDAQAFTLRAEQQMDQNTSACQQDLDMALVVDPQCIAPIGCGRGCCETWGKSTRLRKPASWP